MLVFLVIVVNSKHLHIFTAPLNVLFSRRPDGLGAAQPMRSDGKLLDFEEADPDADIFGRGKIERHHLEGLPRLLHLHRVRPLPVAVPGVEHRQAAVAEDAHPRPA